MRVGHACRLLTPLLGGFVIGSVLSLMVFPLLQAWMISSDCGLSESIEDLDSYQVRVVSAPVSNAKGKGATRKLNRPRFLVTELGKKSLCQSCLFD